MFYQSTRMKRSIDIKRSQRRATPTVGGAQSQRILSPEEAPCEISLVRATRRSAARYRVRPQKYGVRENSWTGNDVVEGLQVSNRFRRNMQTCAAASIPTTGSLLQEEAYG